MILPSDAPTDSRLFDFLRAEVLSRNSGSEVARRSGLSSATVYRWYRDNYTPDQTAAFERTLAAFGFRMVIERIPPPTDNPIQFEVRNAPNPPSPPR